MTGNDDPSSAVIPCVTWSGVHAGMAWHKIVQRSLVSTLCVDDRPLTTALTLLAGWLTCLLAVCLSGAVWGGSMDGPLHRVLLPLASSRPDCR